MRRLLSLAAIASLMTMTSCDATVLSPSSVPITSAQRAAADVDPAFSALESPPLMSAFLGVTDQFNSNFSVSGLGPYPTPTVVTVAASGVLELRWVGGFALPPAGSLAGSIDPGGRRTGFNNDGCTEVSMVAVVYVPPGQTGPIRAWSGCQDGLKNNFTGNALVSGSVIIGRSGDGLQLIPGRCGGAGFIPCFTYHAGHSVTLTRVSAQFSMDVADNEIEPGESVAFLTTVTPASIGQMPPGISQSIQTPFSPLEWRYIPDDEGLPELVVTTCGTARNCTYAPQAAGTMQLTAVVNGRVMTQEQHIEVGSEKVEITPITDILQPTVTVPVGLCQQAMTDIRRRNIRVRVTRGNGTPVAGRQVRLTLKARDIDGGHVASLHAPDRPWGSLPNDIVTTDADGRGVVLWTLPEFSGRVDIKAELVGASGEPDETTVTLGVLGLFELTESAKYNLVGTTDMHPRSHYGSAELLQELRALADNMFADGFVIGFNDMSLELGGRFDLGGQWNASNSHCSHRRGDAVDMQTEGQSDEEKLSMLYYWQQAKHSKVDEGNHYHFKLTPPPAPRNP